MYVCMCLVSIMRPQSQAELVLVVSAEKWVRGRAIDRGEVDVGTQQSQAIPPGLFWRFHMIVHHPTYIKFNLSLSHSALLGVYGRRNIPPTHTQVNSCSSASSLSATFKGKNFDWEPVEMWHFRKLPEMYPQNQQPTFSLSGWMLRVKMYQWFKKERKERN